MKDIVAFDNLKTKVLKYILYKKRTEREIRLKFTQVDKELLDEVIETLKESNYINDDIYIDRFVKETINLKNISLKEIQYKLRNKGIDKSRIEEYFCNQREKLYDYEKNAVLNIIYKKINTMDMFDIIVLLKKKGYCEESIKQGTEEYKYE